MIIKSYIFEKTLQNLKENYFLFYGENAGLKEDLKKLIKGAFTSNDFLYLTQDQLLKDKGLLFKEVSNESLFGREIVFFITETTDKITEIIQEIEKKFKNKKIFLFANMLEKKSKLRNFFEKSENCGAIACYADDETTLKRIIQNKLQRIKGLTPESLNLILRNSNLNRLKLNNEIEKIKMCFHEEPISVRKLSNLLDLEINDNFNILKDEALAGNKIKTNNLLSETIIEDEKIILYLNIINQTINKLLQLVNFSKKLSLENSLKEIKPPIFWKDKPKFIEQSKKWDRKKLNKISAYIHNLEITLKSKFYINKNILMKKFVLDICKIANS